MLVGVGCLCELIVFVLLGCVVVGCLLFVVDFGLRVSLVGLFVMWVGIWILDFVDCCLILLSCFVCLMVTLVGGGF